MKKRILFVAIPESIHTAKWLNQLKEQEWDIYLFPSYEDGPVRINKAISSVKICIPFYSLYTFLEKIGLRKLAVFYMFRVFQLNRKLHTDYYTRRLAKVIRKIKPDLIHSLETQRAGYLVSAVKNNFFKGLVFPTWWHTNWGSDIYIYGRMPQHAGRIREVLENCDFYSCECIRDIGLAKEFGFKGTCLPVYPNTGGFNALITGKYISEAAPTSQRKVIMLKGYQGWAGRALTGIRALERCADVLKGYTIVIYSNTAAEDIIIAATLFSQTTGVPVTLLPEGTPNEKILWHHSTARVSIGLSIGDAISTSLLEAMAVGSFPIQSCTACASEWFKDGESGFIVLPEDPELIENAIRKALSNDVLVDTAAKINQDRIARDADFAELKQKTIASYQQVFYYKSGQHVRK